MSADRELLELAAKAAGIQGTYQHWQDSRDCVSCGIAPDGSPGRMWWNPIRDDGAALRLAVKLRLQIKPGKHLGDGCTVETQRDGVAGCTAFYDDKDEQMRQAIVRAAAEIGRSMP